MLIRAYQETDADALRGVLMEEGSDWKTYFDEEGWPRYIKGLRQGVTYLAFDQDILVGYVRGQDDHGFGVYVYDLLVRKSYRGQHIGQALLEYVRTIHQDQSVYVMSDVDPYYEQSGYQRIGSIFKID
jgi:GNAT superfamily N-acetyltransferase